MPVAELTVFDPWRWLPALYGDTVKGDAELLSDKRLTLILQNPSFRTFTTPEIHDHGTVLAFDNDGYMGQPDAEHHSRAAEHQIDPETRVAKLVWEFPGDADVDACYKEQWYQPYWGDANRLSNGNVLMTAGVKGPTTQTRVFEATREDRTVVWEMVLPANHGLYRALRITPPLIRVLP